MYMPYTHKHTVQPYLDSILGRLRDMLSSQYRIVMEQSVTALATVADSAMELFQTYYPHFMPLLKNILNTPTNDPAYRMLRGKTMECISLIGIAVGKEVFAQDAADVMQMLQASHLHLDLDHAQHICTVVNIFALYPLHPFRHQPRQHGQPTTPCLEPCPMQLYGVDYIDPVSLAPAPGLPVRGNGPG